MTLRELHERIAASSTPHWCVLPPGPGFDIGAGTAVGHTHRAVLRSDVDLILTWGMLESEREYFEPWLGNPDGPAFDRIVHRSGLRVE